MNLFLTFLSVVGLVVSAIILSILIKRKNKQLPDKILISIFSFSVVLCAMYFANVNDIVWLSILLILPVSIINLAIAPLLYLYVKSLFETSENLLKKNKLHFLPALFFLIVYFVLIIVQIIYELKLYEFNEDILKQINELTDITTVLETLYLMFYAIISYLLLNKYQKITKSVYSNISSKDLQWAKSMLIGVTLISGIDVIILVYLSFSKASIDFFHYLQVFNVTFLMAYLGYYGINQSKILLPDFVFNENNEVENSTITSLKITSANAATEINSTALKPEEVESFKQKLEHVLKTDKPHFDEELTLNKLAELIPISPKKLSFLLNHHLHISFYDLINKKRVAEFKERVNNPDYNNYTLLGIAHECGFKSKASFYRVFKKETGMSPSEYKNKKTAQNSLG